MSKYEKQANDFLKKTNTTCTIKEIEMTKPSWDTRYHRTFKVTLKRNNKSYTFNFWGNLNGDDITAYDVLAAIQKYDVGSFDNFCSEYGYDYETQAEKRKVMNIYNAVVKEYEKIDLLFNDVIEKLQNIF